MRVQAARRLSYSTLLALHKCPRMMVLQRLESEPDESIHLAYGSSFGVGFQSLLSGESLEKAVWEAFKAWSVDLLEEKPKDKKSFWYVVTMLEKFNSVKDSYFFSRGWELAYFQGKPAVELGARIDFPDGFYYLIFIDIVLINKRTGELKVLELKTTKYTEPDEALYANSWQAILYSVFLDAIAEEYGIGAYSSYEVLYFIISSAAMDFIPMPFKKSKLQKARALQYIFQDIERIQSYEATGFPMCGESCFNYASYRPCPKFGICHMSIPNVVLKSEEALATFEPRPFVDSDVQFVLSAQNLIDKQLEL